MTGGETVLFPDLVGAKVEVVLYNYKSEVISACKVLEVEACAELNITKKECTIRAYKGNLRHVLNHEMNHCRGWSHGRARRDGVHRWREKKALEKLRWEPFRELSELPLR